MNVIWTKIPEDTFSRDGAQLCVFVIIVVKDNNLNFSTLFKGPFTQRASDDTKMHAFLDAMKRRDRVFTLHAVKPLFPQSGLYMCS